MGLVQLTGRRASLPKNWMLGKRICIGHKGPEGWRAEVEVQGTCSGLRPVGRKPRDSLKPAIKASYRYRGGREKEELLSLKKKKNSYKNRSICNTISQPEAPPPISLETEGEVWPGCARASPTAHVPDEMHQSSGEAGAGAEGPERRGHKAWQQAAVGPTMSLPCLPAHRLRPRPL